MDSASSLTVEMLIAMAIIGILSVVVIGEVKNAEDAPIRDFSREKDVVDRARELAVGAGLSEELAESLMLELIESSLAVQEQGRVRSESAGSGRTALVIGGLGRMGRWFVGFLDSQGFEVVVADPGREFDHGYMARVRRGDQSVLKLCRRRIMATLFFEASTRTDMSFQAAMLRLGGEVVATAGGVQFSSVYKGENLADSVRAAGSYADVVVLRHPQVRSSYEAAFALDQLATRLGTRPVVISGGDGVGEHRGRCRLASHLRAGLRHGPRRR